MSFDFQTIHRYSGLMIESLGLRFEQWVRKHMPDPFVLVLLLTLITFLLAGIYQPQSILQLPQYWLDGFWKLLSFAMQMVLIIVTGESLITTKPILRFFKFISNIPKNPKSALTILSFFALIGGWLHWGFGLIGAALLAKELARTLQKKSIQVDYPLLGTAAYSSMLLWHAGTTASAPLLINTPGHFLEHKIGLIPLSQTIFLPWNLFACAVLLFVTPWIITKMHPSSPRSATDFIDLEPTAEMTHDILKVSKIKTPAEILDQNPFIGKAVGALGVISLILFWMNSGMDLTHNIVNFLLLSIGLILHRSPVSYARAIANSVKGTTGVILQFPFYGGIMGLMEGSHLGHAIAGFFVNFATAQTLPFFAYLASVFTKIFVPSGGGEWAIEGPVMLEAAKNLGAAVGKTTMSIAYGNMVGNMFQPFWAIPLLSVLGLNARDIMGFCLVIFLFAFPFLGLVLLLT
jgi:short-chain fatty acids transporter